MSNLKWKVKWETNSKMELCLINCTRYADVYIATIHPDKQEIDLWYGKKDAIHSYTIPMNTSVDGAKKYINSLIKKYGLSIYGNFRKADVFKEEGIS